MDRLQSDRLNWLIRVRKGKREPAGIGCIFDVLTPDPRSERLLLFGPNLNAATYENGFVDQCFALLRGPKVNPVGVSPWAEFQLGR